MCLILFQYDVEKKRHILLVVNHKKSDFGFELSNSNELELIVNKREMS